MLTQLVSMGTDSGLTFILSYETVRLGEEMRKNCLDWTPGGKATAVARSLGADAPTARNIDRLPHR